VKLLAWIIMVPVALAVISFSVNNRATMTVDLWPAPFSLDAPAFAVVLVSVVLGMVIGAIIAWFSGGKTRQRARAHRRRADANARELAALRQQLGEAKPEEPAVDKALLGPPPGS